MNERESFIIEDLDESHLVIKAEQEYRVRKELEAENYAFPGGLMIGTDSHTYEDMSRSAALLKEAKDAGLELKSKFTGTPDQSKFVLPSPVTDRLRLSRTSEELSLPTLADLASDNGTDRTLRRAKPTLNSTLVAKHADGSVDEIPLAHSFNEGQIEWFKAGSALNLMAAKAKAAGSA
ncbi:Aconitate hydratase, mitochondrial [Psilocybe cubensis]|uniref:Aconitate hydratase, mitochondrial n=2 Tax=Psilocybe cubensis TaxID=181762 RepID=A0ACB8GJV3_PSICU|nr:Aconitate hydratase, mitochondrial [Psilocybe cubensis]KAH9475990.1 Aconitate hydratase, mitochondrial [Psilocybe cubensis]